MVAPERKLMAFDWCGCTTLIPNVVALLLNITILRSLAAGASFLASFPSAVKRPLNLHSPDDTGI
jgi:hypothetical protein